VRRVWREVLELVYPPRCDLCGRLGEPCLCPACAGRIEYLSPPYCLCCGRPLVPTADAAVLCGECRLAPPKLAGARSLGLHLGVLRQAILQLKFGRRRELAEPLGRLLALRLTAEAAQPNPLDWSRLRALLPVGLHPRRRSWRGFDQALVLSRTAAREGGWECWERALVRVKNTRQQIGLSAGERRANLRGAFQVPNPEPMIGGDFLLIDDVYTTGATLEEAAKAVLRAGARAVYGLTLSRAVPVWHAGTLGSLGDEQDSHPGWNSRSN
jgi:ComF family protein